MILQGRVCLTLAAAVLAGLPRTGLAAQRGTATATPVFVEVGCFDGTQAEGQLMRSADGRLSLWREPTGETVALPAEGVQRVRLRPGRAAGNAGPGGVQTASPPSHEGAGETDAPAGPALPAVPFARQLARLMEASPELQRRLAALAEEPRWKALLDDPDVQRSLEGGRYWELLANPKVRDLAKDDVVRQVVAQLAGKTPADAPAPAAGQQPIAVSARVVTPPDEGRPLTLELRLAIAPGHYVYHSADHFFALDDVTVEGLGPANVSVSKTQTFSDPFSDPPGAIVEVLTGDTVVTVTRAAVSPRGAAWRYAGRLQYQGCSKEICFNPGRHDFAFSGAVGAPEVTTEAAAGQAEATPPAGEDGPGMAWRDLAGQFRLGGRTTGYLGRARFIEFLTDAAGGRARGGPFDNLGNRSTLVALLLILLGGIALNLTPCVLPMIPVNLAIIGVGARGGSRRQGLALGATYGLAMALVYGLLGVVVVLTGATFGAFTASPWFNLGIAVLFLVLALAMAGVFNLDISRLGAGLRTERWRKGSFALAFLMGGVAALLAGACVAPVVIAVLLLAAQQYAQGNYAGLLFPFLLGLGMGLPWPLAGAGLSFAPRPGRWMNVVKYAFAAVVFALAIYYAHQAVRLWRPGRGADAGSGTVTDPAPAAADEPTWHTALAPALHESVRTGKPLLIDFWATWCKNCIAMDRTTFRDAEVMRTMSQFVLVKFQAENTRAPDIAPVLEHFDVLGLPTYVVLVPKPSL
ncbi:MAG: Thiol:disulfide interchange protein DsbD precursor [Lentisphaerae bacterium ADurb.BinA184]|nr:MAG: Thiol:disulfide interchange protein DsbD precursor [Lentisphaerae bacterium ADurb.BinA184]